MGIAKERVEVTTERCRQIADAALRVIGTLGARGLTHRAVDEEARLPPGSTSYYCRRRVDLVALALRRHADLELQGLILLEGALRGRATTPQELADALGSALSEWAARLDEVSLAARFELFLAASRDADLQRIIVESRERFVATLVDTLQAAQVRDPTQGATAIIALVEGVLLERVRLGCDAFDRHGLVTLLHRVLSDSS